MEDAQAIKRKIDTYKAVHLFLAILAGAALGIGYYTGYNKGYEEGYFLGAWHSELYYEATGKFGFTACTPSEEWALKNMHRCPLSLLSETYSSHPTSAKSVTGTTGAGAAYSSALQTLLSA